MRMPDASLTTPTSLRRHYYVQQNIYAGILRRSYGVDVSRMVLLQLHPGQTGYIEHEVPRLDHVADAIFAEREAEVKRSTDTATE